MTGTSVVIDMPDSNSESDMEARKPLNQEPTELQLGDLKNRRKCAPKATDQSDFIDVTNLVCDPSPDGPLNKAAADGNRLAIAKLLHKEYLCHKEDQHKGLVCIKKQLSNDIDVANILETFDSFFQTSKLKKWLSFLACVVSPCILGVAVACADIWQDMRLTDELGLLSRNDSLPKEITFKYEKAYRMSAMSQIVPCIPSLLVWIWNTLEFCFPRDVESDREASDPRLNGNGNSHTATQSMCRIMGYLVPILPFLSPIFAALTFLPCFQNKVGLFRLVLYCNVYSVTLICGISFKHIICKWKVEFGEMEKTSILHVIERQFGLVRVIESCLEATMQLVLETWLLSQEEDLCAKLEIGFFQGSIQILKSVFLFEAVISELQVKVIAKLLLSCTSIVFSVAGSYRLLKNQSIAIHHLIFIFLSLNFQLWARISAIFAWYIHTKHLSLSWQVSGIGLFLVINMMMAFILKLLTWKNTSGVVDKGIQNVPALAMDAITSAVVLVRIPKVTRSGKVIPQETFTLHCFYFIFSFAFNIIFTLLARYYSRDPQKLNGTFGEICLFFFGACICQCLYYTVFGHPWRALIRKKFWKNVLEMCSGNAFAFQTTETSLKKA